MTRVQRIHHFIVGIGGIPAMLTFPLWVWLFFLFDATGTRHPFEDDLARELFSVALIVTYLLGFLCAVRCLIAALRNNPAGRFRRFSIIFATCYFAVSVAVAAYTASVFLTDPN